MYDVYKYRHCIALQIDQNVCQPNIQKKEEWEQAKSEISE